GAAAPHAQHGVSGLPALYNLFERDVGKGPLLRACTQYRPVGHGAAEGQMVLPDEAELDDYPRILLDNIGEHDMRQEIGHFGRIDVVPCRKLAIQYLGAPDGIEAAQNSVDQLVIGVDKERLHHLDCAGPHRGIKEQHVWSSPMAAACFAPWRRSHAAIK